MIIEVKVPQLPESVSEATLMTWHKKAGDFVNRDENVIDLETDKVVLELPAPQGRFLGHAYEIMANVEEAMLLGKRDGDFAGRLTV
ncbi:biotin/lipoyl-containing protein, partial [Aquitalea pelogenes]|uniref:biotin/lipoyl-containing protein n=1 Tax=Aquitalea pelogenes TaxID=1293573 RepID=UPI000B00EFFD